MNPFTTPDRIYILRRPQDMRAGVQRLSALVAAEFGMDPADGSLYVFVSRDLEKCKMLRVDVNGGCLYYARLAEGTFRLRRTGAGDELVLLERRRLMWLLDGLDPEMEAPAPVAGGRVL